MSRAVPVYVPSDGNRTLESAWLLLPGGKPMDAASGYLVTLGISGEDGRMASVGTFDFRSRSIPANGRASLTGASRLGRSLGVASMLLASVEPYGSPSVPATMSVQALLGTSVRAPAHRAGQASERDAIDGLARYAQSAGFGEQVLTVPLVCVGDDDGDAAYDSYLQSNKDYSATSFTDGDVSLTVVMPSWASRARVQLNAHATILGLVAATTASVAIGDGTTDRGEEFLTTSTTEGLEMSTSCSLIVYRGTRFSIRFKVAANSIRASAQSLSAQAVFS